MINETQYLSSIYNYQKRGMEKNKIEKGINADYRNGKITLKIFNKAMQFLNKEKNINNENKVIRDLKTRIKVITDPEEQRKSIEQVKKHHKIGIIEEIERE